MEDYKHLRPVNFNDDKDKNAAGIGYTDYDDLPQPDPEEKIQELGKYNLLTRFIFHLSYKIIFSSLLLAILHI